MDDQNVRTDRHNLGVKVVETDPNKSKQGQQGQRGHQGQQPPKKDVHNEVEEEEVQERSGNR